MTERLLLDDRHKMNIENSSLTTETPIEYAPTDVELSLEIGNKQPTPIQNFYNDQSILITGGTGFIGKLLIQKLLRDCPGITRIYVLIRPKVGKNLVQRMEELIEDSLFSTLRKEQPTFQDRIIPIKGDCSFSNLGISKIDRATLIREVSIVFNVAATVRFNEKMKSAIAINVRSLRDLLNLSKEMPKLKSFVHVSTAYANCIHNPIKEMFYDPPMDGDRLIDLMNSLDEKFLDVITPQLLGIWPNTYVYTKSAAENVIRKHRGSIPIGIFRPAIVISTYREPFPGWIDNLYGPVGLTANIFIGLIRTHQCDGSVIANMVPGDMTANGLIASAWDIANNRRSNEDIPIYNYVSNENPITYGRYIEIILNYGKMIPSEKTIWFHTFKITKYRSIYLIYVYVLHLLPALIIDTIALCVGKQPRLLRMYNKIQKISNVLSYFSTKDWNFTNERWNELKRNLTSEDSELFFCDIKQLAWDNYFRSYLLGIRTNILKDSIETLPQARIKLRRFHRIHQALKLIIACFLFIVAWAIISRLLVPFESS